MFHYQHPLRQNQFDFQVCHCMQFQQENRFLNPTHQQLHQHQRSYHIQGLHPDLLQSLCGSLSDFYESIFDKLSAISFYICDAWGNFCNNVISRNWITRIIRILVSFVINSIRSTSVGKRNRSTYNSRSTSMNGWGCSKLFLLLLPRRDYHCDLQVLANRKQYW